MKTVISIVLGAVLLVAAAAGFIIVPEHRPVTKYVDLSTGSLCTPTAGCTKVHTGFATRTVYDLVRVGTWAALIVGLLIVIVGLINLTRRPRLEATP